MDGQWKALAGSLFYRNANLKGRFLLLANRDKKLEKLEQEYRCCDDHKSTCWMFDPVANQ